MKLDVGFNIYLPPDYESSGVRRYPVIIWLHSAGGNESSGVTIATALRQAFPRNVIPAAA